MPEQSSNTISEDEFFLKSVIDFLVESWKMIALGGIVGGLLSLGFAMTLPARYQATANIQVAKVAGVDVEAAAFLLEKLKMPMYYSQKTYVACNVIGNLEPGVVITKTLKPVLARNAPIITISYIEESPEDAKKCLESVLDDIRANQDLLAKPIFESKTNQLLNLKLKLESAEKIMTLLPMKNTGFDFSDSKFSASTLLLATALSKENEIKDLRTQINDLEILLQEPQTKKAFFSTPIYAPQKKVSPRKASILVGGLMAGLFISLLIIIGKRTYGVYKASNRQ